MKKVSQNDNHSGRQCKYCTSDIPSAAKICPACKSYQKWYLNYLRISDVLLFASLSVSLAMAIFSYLNFNESRKERVDAGKALTTANDAAIKASDAVMRATDVAARASQAETSLQGTVERVKKIEQSSLDVSSTIKQVQQKTNSDFKTFEANLNGVKEETITLRLYYDVRAGKRSALNDLMRLALDSKSRKGMLAKSLLDDSNLYFKDYKYNFTQQQVISEQTRKHFRPPAEEIYEGIYKHKNAAMREAYINEIGQRDFKYFAQDLVKIARDDPNLKVACRAEKAIETLTGERFEDYPPYNQVQAWWDKIGNKDVKYSHSLHRLKELPANCGKKQLDCILPLKEITNSQQGMCLSHTNMARIYMAEGVRNMAKEHAKTAIEQCDAQIEAALVYAKLLYEEDLTRDVIKTLSNIRPFVNSIVGFEITCRSSFPKIVNEDGFKKLFENK